MGDNKHDKGKDRDRRGKRQEKLLGDIAALIAAAQAELQDEHQVLADDHVFLSGEHGDIVGILQFVFSQLQQVSAQLITIETKLDNLANQGGGGPVEQDVNWNSG